MNHDGEDVREIGITPLNLFILPYCPMPLFIYRSGSILVQVMACCLMAPSHCLNQFWLTQTLAQYWSPHGAHCIADYSGSIQLSIYIHCGIHINSSPLVPNICVIYASVNPVSISTDNGLSPIWCQAIIFTNAGLLSIGPLQTNFLEIYLKSKFFSENAFENVILSRGKWVNSIVDGQYWICSSSKWQLISFNDKIGRIMEGIVIWFIYQRGLLCYII